LRPLETFSPRVVQPNRKHNFTGKDQPGAFLVVFVAEMCYELGGPFEIY